MHCNHSYRSLSIHHDVNLIMRSLIDTFQSRDWLTDSYSVSSSLSHKNGIIHLWEERALSSSKLWTCRIKRWKRTGEGVEKGREGREERGEGRRKEGERKKEEELEHCAIFSKGIEAHRPSPPLLLNFHGKWADRAVLGLWKSESGENGKPEHTGCPSSCRASLSWLNIHVWNLAHGWHCVRLCWLEHRITPPPPPNYSNHIFSNINFSGLYGH